MWDTQSKLCLKLITFKFPGFIISYPISEFLYLQEAYHETMDEWTLLSPYCPMTYFTCEGYIPQDTAHKYVGITAKFGHALCDLIQKDEYLNCHQVL